MNTFRNKQFKNQLDPKYAFYDCLRTYEIKSSSEKLLEECVESYDLGSPSKHSNNEKMELLLLVPFYSHIYQIAYTLVFDHLTSFLKI